MNKETILGNWNELKGKIRQKWSKLTDDEVDSIKGNLQELTGKIQRAYGMAKEKAEQEFEEFKQKHFSSDEHADVSEVNDDDFIRRADNPDYESDARPM